MHNIVVLISGNGSNLQAIIDSCHSENITNSQVAAVISDQEKAYGLERARAANIDALYIAPDQYLNKQHYEQALICQIEEYQPSVIILAGFMRILGPTFVQHYQGKILNIHPSLLPKYPGLNTHQRAIDNKDQEHGASVHFVTEELDGGPLILQATVPVLQNDTISSLAKRVQQQEYRIYPLVIQWLLSQRLQMQNGKALLDGEILPINGGD